MRALRSAPPGPGGPPTCPGDHSIHWIFIIALVLTTWGFFNRKGKEKSVAPRDASARPPKQLLVVRFFYSSDRLDAVITSLSVGCPHHYGTSRYLSLILGRLSRNNQEARFNR